MKYFITPTVCFLFFASSAISGEYNYSYKFNNYPVLTIYKGKIADIDYSSDPEAKRFRTRLNKGIKDGPNFAGFYRLIEWGCGTNCSTIVIVNVKNGKISDWNGTCGISTFKLDSRLLVLNPGATENKELGYPAACETELYLLENNQLHIIE